MIEDCNIHDYYITILYHPLKMELFRTGYNVMKLSDVKKVTISKFITQHNSMYN